jgi:hypothetical protein
MKQRLASIVCPRCGATGTMRKILYGMPSDDFDFEKYAVGGCVIGEDPAEIECSECEWQGKRP